MDHLHVAYYIGIHAHAAYYDMAFAGKTRWQNVDSWRNPLYGGGLSAGYSYRFGKDKRWGIEAEAGFGYAYLSYDCFYNVPNGAWFNSSTRGYWGLTKANIGISYILSKKNRNSQD